MSIPAESCEHCIEHPPGVYTCQGTKGWCPTAHEKAPPASLCHCPDPDGSEGTNPNCPRHGMFRKGGVIRLERERDRILAEAARLISGDREATYGSAIDDFTRTGKMWAAILGLDEITAEQVAMCMTALKIGRLCNTPGHQDSWIDACGYLALGGDIADEHARDERTMRQR